MVQRLRTADTTFKADFDAFLSTKREVSDDVDRIVQDIIAGVRTRGDNALIEYSN
jgi:histidinol dehydrogenase